MHAFSLKSFGVGDGWPCSDRFHSSFLYQFGKVNLLVDCGEPVSCSYKASNLSYDDIDAIFISHTHCDHIGGFFMLMQGFWLEQRQKDLPVYLPGDAIEPIRKMLDACYIFDELLAFRLLFKPLQEGQTIAIQNVSVTPHYSSHLDSLKAAFSQRYKQSFQAFCFLLESDQFRIGHSADIGAPTDLAPLLKKPLDLLVCELAHFKPKELFTYLNGFDIKQILFTHVSRRHWDALEETRALATKLLPNIPFSFAHDGEEISL